MINHTPENIRRFSKPSIHQFRSKILGISLHGVLEALFFRDTKSKVSKLTGYPIKTEKYVVWFDVKVTEVVVVKMA